MVSSISSPQSKRVKVGSTLNTVSTALIVHGFTLAIAARGIIGLIMGSAALPGYWTTTRTRRIIMMEKEKKGGNRTPPGRN